MANQAPVYFPYISVVHVIAKSEKIEKLQKYITNLEADGDRLSRQLVIANSYRACFDTRIQNPVFMVTLDCKINYGNKAFRKMTGLTEDELGRAPDCTQLLDCDRFRKGRCLLKECFESKQAIDGFACDFVNSADRRFKLVVDVLPILNVANNEVLGGIEIFREVIEDTQLQYLMFGLNGQEYGVSIKKLRCVISMVEINHVANLPAHVLGVINLRGEIIPVIGIKERLGLTAQGSAERPAIIILDTADKTGKKPLGFIVDQVNSVVTINARDIESPAETGFGTLDNLIAGIAKVGGQTKILLDVSQAMA